MFENWGMPAPFKPGESLSAYDDNAHLASAVDLLAQEMARTPFFLKKTNAKGEITIIQKHQALDTLKKPQPTSTGKSLLTSMDLKLVTGYHLCLDGEAFWLLDKRLRVNGAPTMIDILLPEFVYPIIKNGELVEYVYRLPEKEIRIRPEDVVHFKLPGRKLWQRGHSPLQSVRYALDTNKEADILNLRKLQNGSIPGGTLETEQSISDESRLKILQAWNQKNGGRENAGKTAMLPQGLKFNKIQESNADMQYVEAKNMNRDEILARFRVGLELLGRTESQTRANAEAAIFIFQKFGATFFIEKFADTLNNEFLPAFPGTDGLEFGFPDPVPANMEEKRLNADTLFRNAGMTPDEMRKTFGLEPLNIKGVTDIPYAPIGMIPAGEPPPDLSLAA